MSTPVRVAICVVVLAVYLSQPQAPSPAPTPAPPAAFSLDGLFVGETAADDAAILAALADEIASEIEWDGQQPDPMLKTGVAFDELRTRARVSRMRGESIGERQPRVREAVGTHLRKMVGEDGGPVDAEQRAKWVAAYRDIAEACRHALRR